MEPFQYHRPQTLAEALCLLQDYGGEARVLAGGQSLMPLLKEGLLAPRALVSLGGLPELQGLGWDPAAGLRIGAMTPQRQIETSPLVREKCPALAEALSRVASVPVRNLGTLGGNLCHAAPGADPPAILIALGAWVRTAGQSGERRLPLEELFAGPYETVLAEGEVLAAIEVPPLPPGARAVYLKHSVRAIDPAMVGIGVMADLADGLVREVRIGMVGAGPRPLRALAAEEALLGRPLEDSAIRQAAQAAAGQAQPLSDAYASAEYRRKMVPVFLRRALEQLRGGYMKSRADTAVGPYVGADGPVCSLLVIW